jgi:hypothetical protein
MFLDYPYRARSDVTEICRNERSRAAAYSGSSDVLRYHSGVPPC